MEAVDNEVLHAYILVHTAGEPRSIGKGSWGNGFAAWRKLKNRFDPETEMNQIGATFRALRLTRITYVKDVLTALERTRPGNIRKSHELPC